MPWSIEGHGSSPDWLAIPTNPEHIIAFAGQSFPLRMKSTHTKTRYKPMRYGLCVVICVAIRWANDSCA